MTTPPVLPPISDGSVAKNPIWIWLNRHSQVIGSIGGLLIILGALWAIGQFLFGSPPLAVTVEQTALHVPDQLSTQLQKSLTDSAVIRDSALHAALVQTIGFVDETTNFTTISVTNTTSTSFANLDVRVQGVWALSGWSVSGDYLGTDERSQLLKLVKYDEASKQLSIKGLPRLPPKATLTIYLWGNVFDAAFFDLGKRLMVTYDGGAGQIVHTARVSGLDAFIYENAGILVLMLLVVNLLLIGALTREKETGQAEANHGAPTESDVAS